MAALDDGLVFEDQAGFSMTPLPTPPCSRRGPIPVVRAWPDGPNNLSWMDYRDLIQTAHQQLGGPIVLVWDNLNTRLTAGMRSCIAERTSSRASDCHPTDRTSPG